MARYCVAKQGDCIYSIAASRGVDWRSVWGHPKNAALRARRSSPGILQCGDVVFIPDAPWSPTVTPGQTHRFRAASSVTIRVRVVEPDDGGAMAALAGVAYELRVNGRAYEGTTDGDGYVIRDVPAHATQAELILEPGTQRETSMIVRIGHLDPHGERTGVEQRLKHLGFLADAARADLAAAISDFQRAHDLPVTGAADDATLAKLVELHGS